MTILYTAKATATNGREGRAKTDDSKIDVEISPPGSDGPGTNPEQLFAAGYASCFGQALKAMAQQEGLHPSEFSVHATVELHKEDSGFFISAELNAFLPGLSQDDAEKLTTMAHKICPYSKATRGNIEVKLSANDHAIQKAA